MNVICECCYVIRGLIRSCECKDGPMRTDKKNQFGLAWPETHAPMGRNETDKGALDCYAIAKSTGESK
jgi:hypothetical protein